MSDYKIMLDTLTLLPYNPRSCTPEQMARIKASISEGTKLVEGWNPTDGFRLNGSILVNVQGLRVVAGNQRVAALRELGQDWVHRDDVSWIDVTPASPEEKERCLTLNNPHVGGDWTVGGLEMVDGLKELKVFTDAGLDRLRDTLAIEFSGWEHHTPSNGGTTKADESDEDAIRVICRKVDKDSVLKKVREATSDLAVRIQA